MSELVLGPLLRYVGEREATIWVETDCACEVEILGNRTPTFEVSGHHYALARIDELEPGTATPYEVHVDGECRWPPAHSPHPPSVIRTIKEGTSYRVIFGSCRVARPHEPPYNLKRDADARAKEIDALYTYALRMTTRPPEEWPDLLLWLGDQVYADDVSNGTERFIASRRTTDDAPGSEVADFEEYTRLYLDSWSDPLIRWILSTVSSAMIFDDHDIVDDWNISEAWIREIRRQPWWHERIVGGIMSYWVYQHLGNLSPSQLDDDPVYRRITAGEDAGPLVRELAERSDHDVGAMRWSFHRDLGRTRLVVIDSRAGRVLGEQERRMVDEREWDYIQRSASGDFDHVLIATSVPFLLAPGMHHLEQWNERVCAGAWGGLAARAAERIRQAIDLEHWAAFDRSFRELAELERSVASGERGRPPATVITLSGDVHHAYVQEVAFRSNGRGDRAGERAAVYQAVCSPMRNALSSKERRIMRFGWSRPFTAVARLLARAAGARDQDIRWRSVDESEPWFNNQLATLDLDGRTARVRLERPGPGDGGPPQLEQLAERRLA
ncbi:MAG: Phosphodiesterase/alkaline phosphatase D [uncultured Solirubrobacterales bacterium]|uniref:Phosphodiesterase/alkaline phosphatase D n=1 Tax=uncultured Solirubrobacterales bacterium TaxID=768556 RepID=A0A6J4S9H2_9ACTN|nr:MAG: Phosphodiesterase/alkaline phosphatase D [uncultured Solirubrobacterales bacterium]